MTEYKVNTVGWQLSQFNEPLKSRALGIAEDHAKPCGSLEDAITSVLNCLIEGSIMWTYWQGVYVYYFGGLHIDSKNFKDGFDLAHECDPWREDKAIVDSPEKPESWVDAEIRKYRDNIEKVLTFDAVSPTPEISNMEDLGSLADFHFPKIVKSDALPPNHFVGIGDDGNPFIGKLSTSIIPPTWEIEAPQRAVVGYEEPKPIDTIEKKHELKIQNLELAKYHQGKEIENLQARVEQLEGVVGKLEQQIEYVYRNLPKDFDGTR